MPDSAAPSTRLSIPAALAAAFGFWRERWLFCLIAGLPYVAAMAATYGFQAQMLAGETTAAAGYWLAFPVMLAISVCLNAAVYRMALHGERGPFLGLALGRDEWRMAGATLLVAALTMLVVAPVAILFTAVFVGLTMAALAREGAGPEVQDNPETAFALLGGGEWLAVAAIAVPLCLLMFWFIARISLAYAATALRRKVLVLQAWAWSRGNGLRLTAALLILSLPVYAISFGLIFAFGAGGLIVPDAAPAPDAGTAALAALASGMFGVAVSIPLFTGLYAHAARLLDPGEADGDNPR